MEPRFGIRTLYLYLAALVGLVLVSIGGIQLVDMALKAWVFTQAESEQRIYAFQPPAPPLERIDRIGTSGDFTEEERNLIRQWLREYREWEQRTEGIDPVTAQRHRTASTSLAMILIGLPLYLYHWGLIRRESRRTNGLAA